MITPLSSPLPQRIPAGSGVFIPLYRGVASRPPDRVIGFDLQLTGQSDFTLMKHFLSLILAIAPKIALTLSPIGTSHN